MQSACGRPGGNRVLLPNSFASALLPARAGVAGIWGYIRWRTRHARTVARPKTPLHQADYYQHLVRELGIETGPLEPVLSIPVAAMTDARSLLADRGWDSTRPLIVLAPGAAYGRAKQWIPSHVVRLVTDLSGDRRVTCALVGSRGDASTTAGIRAAVPRDCRSRVLDLAGTTTLPVLAAIDSVAGLCLERPARCILPPPPACVVAIRID
jgi:heptosyltransferase-2